MILFVFFHILTMFAAVTVGLGSSVWIQRTVRTRDVRFIQNTFKTVMPLGRIVPVLFLLGAIFGLIAGYLGYNLLQGWLIATYVIFILAMAFDGAISTRWRVRIAQAANSSSPDKPSPELNTLLDGWIPRYGLWIDVAFIALILFVMVFKPFL